MKILVVDDDPQILALLTRFLGKQGFEVFAASDGPQALDTLAREQVSAVVTDHAMPFMDGTSLIRTLRADERYKSLPVIVMTAFPTDEVQDRNLRAGAGFVLEKPLDLGKLLALLKFAI